MFFQPPTLHSCNTILSLFRLQIIYWIAYIANNLYKAGMASTANTGEASLTASAAQAIAPELFPARTSITPAQIEAGINVCLGIQRRAVTFGKRPFAACLLGPDNETVLLMHQSVDQVNHAESSLARLAYCHYSKEYLWRCTLVSTWEPCAMCSGMSLFSSRK